MTEKTFFEQVKNILTFNQIPSPTNLTLTQYYNRFKNVPDTDFAKMVDWILENVEYKRFPIMYDFIQAKKAVVHPVNEYTPEARNDNVQAYGPYSSELAKKFEIMDRIRYLHCKDKINPHTGKPFGNDCKNVVPGKIVNKKYMPGTPEIMTHLYKSAVEKGKVFDINSEKWVDIYEGGNTFNPTEMGF